MNILRFMVTNGGRPLTLAVSAALLSLTGLAMVLLAVNCWPEAGMYAPLGGYNLPQPVSDKTIPVGGLVVVGPATKCNLSDETLSLKITTNWRRKVEGLPELVVPSVDAEQTLPPGCTTSTFGIDLIPEVIPGMWIRQGTDCVYKGGETQCFGWYTEPFEVVP